MVTSGLVGRIVARTGVALWRQRIALLLGGAAIGALGLYQLTSAGPTVPGSQDCADATMAAMTGAGDDASRAAYACFAPGLRSQNEEVFVQSLRERQSGIGGQQVHRVGDHRGPDGARVVFYALDSRGSSIGYIVYLDAQGRVERVE
jgi:hypothetical protein